MSLWIDVKYANLVSVKLDRFKVKSHNPYQANFRCPICGDSKKSQLKARGFLFQKQDSIIYHCHNCGAGRNIASFLRDIAPEYYQDYNQEVFLEKDKPPVEKKEPAFKHPNHMRAGSPLLKLKKISQLKWDHPAKQYVVDRKIPPEAHSRLFYCSKFATWTNTIIPNKLKTDKDSPRLVIPFLDKNEKLIGYQGRSFDPNDKLRYISIMLQDEIKVFGLDKADLTKKHYIVEGPIDSLFLPNCISMAGADINIDVVNEHSVFVYDNEPRNAEIVKRIGQVAQKYKVCIWPNDLKYKDINDMILGGMTPQEVQRIIDSCTYEGILAQLKFNEWKKI